MRLIGSVKSETEAFTFFAFLKSEGIDCVYEETQDPNTKQSQFSIWVNNEDDVEAALNWLDVYQKNPNDPKFEVKYKEPPPNKQEQGQGMEEQQEQGINVQMPSKRSKIPPFIPITKFTILLCLFFFFWNSVQKIPLYKEYNPETNIVLMTGLESVMMYDFPLRFALSMELYTEYPEVKKEEPAALPSQAQQLYLKIEQTPFWQGFYYLMVGKEVAPLKKGPTFEKIRQGQVWRLFSPILLHGSLLHILFNMLWAYLLGKQIEVRVGAARYIALILLTALVSNTFQYLMSGPLFLGYSGVIAGFAGFIWMRQRIAPWEGYPLQRATILFLAIFIIGIFLVQVLVFFLQLFGVTRASINIANTAHITGALVGILCAKIPLFSKGS